MDKPFTQDELTKIAEVADVLEGRHRKWIEDYVATCGIDRLDSYDTLMQAAKDYLETGEYFSTGDDQVDLPEEFWDHYEALKNIKVKPDDRYSFFSCAC